MTNSHSESPVVRAPLGVVRTERLLLSPIVVGDVEAFAPIFAKVEVWRYPYGRGMAFDETSRFVAGQISDWETYGYGLWAMRSIGTNAMLGYVGLSIPRFYPSILPAVEVGWRLDPEWWGRGYATEGAAAALDQAFTTLELDEVWSMPQVDNVASIAVAERLGMVLDHEAEFPANERRGPVVGAVYRIDSATWLKRRWTGDRRTDG